MVSIKINKTINLVLTSAVLTLAFFTPSLAMDNNTNIPERSLVFLDGYLEPDNFNFLYKKHQNNSSIIEQSNEAPQGEEKVVSLAILEQLVPRTYPTKDDFTTNLMLQFFSSVYDPQLGELDAAKTKILKTQEHADIDRHFASKVLSSLDNLIYHFQKSPTRTVLEDILTGAQQIHHLQITNGI